LNPSTWKELDAEYEAFPMLMAGPVPASEVTAASTLIGLSISDDYAAFLTRYGSAIVGPYPIFGLRPVEPMGNEWSVIEVTRRFHADCWPGVGGWIVFSRDHGGNPIGLSPDGEVWVSDHEQGGVTRLASSFEAFLLQALASIER